MPHEIARRLAPHAPALPDDDVPITSRAASPGEVVPMLVGATMQEVERELLLQTLASCEGNRTHAARVLGLSVRTMRNKIRQYSADGIDVPSHP